MADEGGKGEWVLVTSYRLQLLDTGFDWLAGEIPRTGDRRGSGRVRLVRPLELGRATCETG